MRKLLNEELNRLTVEEFKARNKIPLIIILDNVRSMNNIGSVFRTGDAFIIEHVYLCGITACPPNKEIHKTALGATESVNWTYEKDTLELVKKLKNEQVNVIAIEQTEESILLNDFKIEKNKKYALILGNEVKGVNQDVINECHNVIELPQYGTKHSLNISVCAGVVIWEFFKALKS